MAKSKRVYRHPDCSYCQANPTGMLPPHDASDQCENPKPYKHCTCDRCF